MTELQGRLFQNRDDAYRLFQSGLIPDIDPDVMIGVRTPELRKIAKGLTLRELGELPHRYFEENQLHAFILNEYRDFDALIHELDGFLPFVDNWATCDQLRPKILAKYRGVLLPHIRRWLQSDHPYTIRFAMEMLMCHYLDEAFSPEFPELVAGVRSEHDYVRMMAAWYYATALAKQYDRVLPCFTEHRLEKWIHNKAIQKALESRRVTAEQKAFLKSCKIP